jgi:hypothetical protein
MTFTRSSAGLGLREPSGFVVLEDGQRIELPRTLEVVFYALAADTPRHLQAGEADDGLVAFKSAGELLPVVATLLQRSFRRRTLLRNISALRRRLEREFPGGGSLVQTSRWLGWRVAVPRRVVVPARSTRRRLSGVGHPRGAGQHTPARRQRRRVRRGEHLAGKSGRRTAM